LHELNVKEDADKQLVLVQDEEVGFFEAYFPFSLNVQNESVDANIAGLWIGTILPFGFLWSPFVFGDVRPGDGFIIDAIIIALVHFLPVLLLFIPFIGLFLGLPMVIYIWVNLLYLTPVAIINAYDRSIGPGSGGGRKDRPKKKKRRRRRRRSAELDLPGMPEFAQVQSQGVVVF